jgi:hypothetical protein
MNQPVLLERSPASGMGICDRASRTPGFRVKGNTMALAQHVDRANWSARLRGHPWHLPPRDELPAVPIDGTEDWLAALDAEPHARDSDSASRIHSKYSVRSAESG